MERSSEMRFRSRLRLESGMRLELEVMRQGARDGWQLGTRWKVRKGCVSGTGGDAE